MRRAIRALVSGVLVVLAARIAWSDESDKSDKNASLRSYFEQVGDDASERKWEMGAQVLPPIEGIIGAPPEKYPVYGIYAWGGEFFAAKDAIKEIGFRSARLSEPWAEAEEALLFCARNGIEVLYTVANAQRHEKQRGWKRPDFESDEAFIADYLETMAEFLARYGPGGTLYQGTGLESPVAVVEILNEPNFHYMIPDRLPQSEVMAERWALYGKLLERTIPLIREKSPTLQIAAFSAGGGGPIVADVPFIEAVTKAHPEIHKTYDILTTHPYMQGAPPEAFKIKPWGPRAMSQNLVTLRELLTRSGAAGKPIWYSELGFPLRQDAGGTLAMPANSVESQLNLDLQAAYIVRQYLWAMRLGNPRVHLMSLHDTDSFNSGIVERGTLAFRPSAHAIRNLIALLPNPKLVAAIRDGQDGVYAYRFVSDHAQVKARKVIVAWGVAGPSQIQIPWNLRSAKIYDIVGNQRQVESSMGAVTLEIGPYPVFLLD